MRLSVDDTPESDAAARSGAVAVAGDVVSMVTESAAVAVDMLPATSMAVEVMLWTPDDRALDVIDQLPALSAAAVPTRVAPS